MKEEKAKLISEDGEESEITILTPESEEDAEEAAERNDVAHGPDGMHAPDPNEEPPPGAE